MRRFQIHRLEADQEGFPFPSAVHLALDEVVGRGSGAIDAAFRILTDWDLSEHARVRRAQFAYVARYGRQQVQPWLDEPVTEFVAFHDSLSELVGEENDVLGSER